MKIATWNVNSLNVRLPQVVDWLSNARPDALALQETKLSDENFPVDAFNEVGYAAAWSGQKTYNGVALISKSPLHDTVTDIPDLDDPQRRILAATIAGVRVINLYVVNGERVDSEKYRYKLDWLSKVSAFIDRQLRSYPALVVLGDFNIAPEDRDVHDPAQWHEKILCSSAERAALRRIMDLGLRDTFRLFDQDAASFSWWDYRAGGFRRNRGLRIDLILASTTLTERCKACSIDAEPRRHDRPSDHAPVWAEFAEP